MLLELASGLLVMDELGSKDQIAAALDELIQDGTLGVVPLIGGRFLVAQPRLLETELDLARVYDGWRRTRTSPAPRGRRRSAASMLGSTAISAARCRWPSNTTSS